MIFALDPVRQMAASECVKFVTCSTGQTILVKGVGALPSNQLAIHESDLLGAFYEAHPNQRAAFAVSPALTGWYLFPNNAIPIPDTIRGHLRAVRSQRHDPAAEMTAMVQDVRALLSSQ